MEPQLLLSREPALECSESSESTSGENEIEGRARKKSYEDAWKDYGPMLKKRCLRWMSGQIDQAEEAFSRAGLLAFEKYPRYQHKIRDPGAWLTRLTYHVCIDLLREVGRLESWEVSDSERIGAAEMPAWSYGSANPEKEFLLSEKRALLEHCIRTLSVRLREVMVPLVFEERSYREIAERLEISESTLRKRVQTARSVIRRRLAAYQSGRACPTRIPVPERGVDPKSEQAAAPSRDSWACTQPVAVVSLPAQVNGRRKDVTFFLQEKPKEASQRHLSRLKSYVEKHPTGWKKRLEMARLLRQLGCLWEAELQFRMVVARRPRQLWGWLELAEIQLALEKRGDAQKSFREALRLAPRPATREHARGLVALAGKDWSEADRAFRQAARIEPSNSGHWIRLAQVHLQAGRPIEAAASCERAVAIDPGDPVARALWYQALLGASRPLPAISQLRRSVELDGSNGVALSALVDLRCQTGRVEEPETRELLERIVRMAPNRAETRRSEARFHLARGEWGKAARVLERFVLDHPNHALGRLYQGRILQQIGQEDLASQRIREALELDGGDREIRCAHLRLVSRSGSTQRIHRVLDQTLELFPEDAGVLLLVIEVLTDVASLPFRKDSSVPLSARLQELIGRARKLHPGFSEVAFRHGRALARHGRPEEALDVLEAGWSLLPDDGASERSVRAALEAAAIRRRRGELESTHHWLSRALEHSTALLDWSLAEAQALRCRVFVELGERSNALAAGQSALDQHLLYPERGRLERMLAGMDRSS